MEHPPDTVKKHLKDEQYKLYKMIWNRPGRPQMNPRSTIRDQVADYHRGDVSGRACVRPPRDGPDPQVRGLAPGGLEGAAELRGRRGSGGAGRGRRGCTRDDEPKEGEAAGREAESTLLPAPTTRSRARCGRLPVA